MYLLYVDDSGSERDTKCRHCILAGFAIRENQTYWVQEAVDEIVMRHLGTSDIELHGTHIRTGKGEWRRYPKQVREDLLKDILGYIATSYPRQLILFATVLDKSAYQGSPLSEELFSQIISRFDMFLKRKYLNNKKGERGIAIFDKSAMEQQFQAWSRMFQKEGNRWGNTLANFAEAPLFLDSRMSRLIQLADIMAYSLFQKYEHNDDRYFSLIQNCFDRDAKLGTNYGLYVR